MSVSKKSATNISKVLTEALPYIQKFSGKNIVIKYGGSAMQENFLRKNFARDIVLMKTVGINPVIVHGGGPQIGKELNKLKLEFKFKNGIRVTTPEMISIIQKVLDEKINIEIKNLIDSWGGQGKSFSGKKINFINATKSKNKSLGEVGKIQKIDKSKLLKSLSTDQIPIISPIGWSNKKIPLNINADEAACFIAGAIKAEKIILLTDVHGIKGINGKKISEIGLQESKKLLKNKKVVKGGMVPKLNAAIQALNKGVNYAHIVDGRVPHAVLLEILTQKGVGTLINR
tara:strand:- start:1095 stop:1955 length:861 start_codon:yes stop_codon:yes gene_type:complete